DARILVIDIASGKTTVLQVKLGETLFRYPDLAFSPEGDLLAMPVSVSTHPKVMLWHIIQRNTRTSYLEDPRDAIEFADKEELLLIRPLFFQGTVRVYNVKQKRMDPRFPVLGQPAVLSPDRLTLCAPAKDGLSKLWDLRNGNSQDLPQ